MASSSAGYLASTRHQSTRGVSMRRRILVACLAAYGALLHLSVEAGAQPKPDGKPKPNQGSGLHVIMKTRLYEVDEAFHKKVAEAKWLSKADLGELETKPP